VTGSQQGAVQRLMELGFSQYEAQAYVGLLGREPLTGYALSNVTGIPQPKVYETLRRLAAKGVVAAMDGEPARFVAVPADQLLADLEDSFRARLDGAQRELATATGAPGADGYRVLRTFSGWAAIVDGTVDVIDGSRRHVYLSVNCPDPQVIASAIGRADARGVVCDVLHFGEPIVELSHGRTVGHDSTRGVVYRRHQARHVAVVADSADVVWALAEDGMNWQSVAGRDPLLAALAKGYIRHDIYVQQIWNEFHEVLAERWGPGMQQLVGELSARRPGPRRPDSTAGSAGPARSAGGKRAVAPDGRARRGGRSA
jgi:sugar-specific transcriptional regulator TrmB